jgi:hypothetical protein
MSITAHRNRPAQLPKIIAPFDALGVPVFQVFSGKLFVRIHLRAKSRGLHPHAPPDISPRCA